MSESGGSRVIGRLVAIIDGDLTGLQRAIGDAQRTLRGAGRTMTDAGRALSLGVTAPLLAIGGIAAKASIDFESAFAGVRKTVDATEEQFAELRQGIRDMAKEAPASATEIAKVAEAAGQLGVQTDAILEFSKVMIDLGETTNLTADEAATAFAQIANVMQLPQDQFDEMGAALVDLGNKGASTERDIIEMAKRIAGAGATVGMSTADVLGLAAALANVGIEAEAGGTAISRVMIQIAADIANGSNRVNEFAEVAGMTRGAFEEMFGSDPAQAIAAFIEGLGRMNDEGLNVFGSLKELKLNEIRVRDALLRTSNAGDVFRKNIELSNQAWEENTALTVEAGRRYETTAAKLEILRNRFHDTMITLGDALVPALMSAMIAAEPIIGVIATLAEGFASLPQPVQTAIVAILGIAAALGPIIFIIGNIVTAGSALIGLFGLIAPAAIALAPVLIAAFPVIAIVAALVAIGAAIYIFRDDIAKAFNSIKDKVEGPLNDVIDFVKKYWREIATFLVLPFAPIVALATDAFGIRTALVNAFKSVIEFLKGLPSQVGSLLASLFDGAKAIVSDAATQLLDALASTFTAYNIGRAIAMTILGPIMLIREGLEAIVPVLATFFGETLPNFFTSTLPNLAVSIVTGIAGALTAAHTAISGAAVGLGRSVIDAVGQGISGAWEGIKTFFTSTVPNFITESIPAAVTAALEWGKSAITAFYDGVVAAWEFVTRIPGEVKDAVKEGFDKLKDAWENIGKQIVYGVWDGIKSLKDWFKTQVENFFKGIYQGAKEALGISSPSKVFAEVGRNIMEGLQVGMGSAFNRGVMPMVGSQMAMLAAGYSPPQIPAMATTPRAFVGMGSGSPSTAADGTSGGFNFQVSEMNIYEKDDREIRDVAFGVQATMNTELRRRGMLQ